MRPEIKVGDRVRFRTDGEIGELNHGLHRNEYYIVSETTPYQTLRLNGNPEWYHFLQFDICNDFSGVQVGDMVELSNGIIDIVKSSGKHTFAIAKMQKEFMKNTGHLSARGIPASALRALRIVKKAEKPKPKPCLICNGTGFVSYDDMDGITTQSCSCHHISEQSKPESATQTPLPISDATQIKVGDWVEFIDAGGRKSQGKYLSNAYDDTILVLDITYNMRCVVPTAKITRKLNPSEVRVKISLAGAVNVCISNVGTDCFSLKTKNTWYAIHYNDLDPATADLVRELVAKQGEK